MNYRMERDWFYIIKLTKWSMLDIMADIIKPQKMMLWELLDIDEPIPIEIYFLQKRICIYLFVYIFIFSVCFIYAQNTKNSVCD